MSPRALWIAKKLFRAVAWIGFIYLYVLWVAYAFFKAGAVAALFAAFFPLGPVALPIVVAVIEWRIPWGLVFIALATLGSGYLSVILEAFHEDSLQKNEAAEKERTRTAMLSALRELAAEEEVELPKPRKRPKRRRGSA